MVLIGKNKKSGSAALKAGVFIFFAFWIMLNLFESKRYIPWIKHQFIQTTNPFKMCLELKI